MKQFTSGGGGGGSKTQLISLAMAEATKLFDKAGGAASGNKQDAVNGAAMTVMKLLVQSKFSGAIGGGNSGGLGGLLSLVCPFLFLCFRSKSQCLWVNRHPSLHEESHLAEEMGVLAQVPNYVTFHCSEAEVNI